MDVTVSAASLPSCQTVNKTTAWRPGTHSARLLAVRPLPAGGALTGSVCGVARCPVAAVAGGVASRAPGSLGAGLRAVRAPPACGRVGNCDAVFDSALKAPLLKFYFTLFAEAGPVDGRAVDEVLTGALHGAVPAVRAAFTGTLAVRALQQREETS